MNSVPRTFSKVRGMWGVFAGRGVKPVSLGLILEKQARKSPNKPLILFEDRIITYRQFNEEANRYADLFISRGFKKGDTVALVMNNRPEYLIVHAGLAKIGVIPALINNNLKAHVLAHAINISAARAVILGHEMLDSYQEATTEIELQQPKTIFIEKETRDLTTPEGMEDLAPLLRKASPQDPVQTATINSADTLEYIYTSGTTGLPKATMVHHGRWIQLAYALGGNSLNMISDDIMYCCLPLYHNSGINIAWATTLFHGATIVIRRKFSTSNFWTDVRRYRANMFIYIGELCRYLNNQPVQPDDGDNPLQY
ncbi:MAG: AMP-binding protein, partial [Chitinophagales bacterium]